MLKINFHPECNIPRFIEGAQEYTKIWEEDGAKICDAIKNISGNDFRADEYNAIILGNKPSQSYPITLRHDYPPDQKKSTLIHELCHKIIKRNEEMIQSSLENHKILDLILYDIWNEIYGKEFADNAVSGEGLWQPLYEEAWKWALGFRKEERAKKYKDFCSI